MSKKAENDSRREFNEQWQNELLFIAGPLEKPLGIACENTFSHNRRHDLNRHYKTQDKTEIEVNLKLVHESEFRKEDMSKKMEEIRRRQRIY